MVRADSHRHRRRVSGATTAAGQGGRGLRGVVGAGKMNGERGERAGTRGARRPSGTPRLRPPPVSGVATAAAPADGSSRRRRQSGGGAAPGGRRRDWWSRRRWRLVRGGWRWRRRGGWCRGDRNWIVHRRQSPANGIVERRDLTCHSSHNELFCVAEEQSIRHPPASPAAEYIEEEGPPRLLR